MNTKPEELFVVAGAFQINTMDDNRAIYTVKVSDFFYDKKFTENFFNKYVSNKYISGTQIKLQVIIAIIIRVITLMQFACYTLLNRLNSVVMFNQCACQMMKLFSLKDPVALLLDGEKHSQTIKKVHFMSLICLCLGNF